MEVKDKEFIFFTIIFISDSFFNHSMIQNDLLDFELIDELIKLIEGVIWIFFNKFFDIISIIKFFFHIDLFNTF